MSGPTTESVLGKRYRLSERIAGGGMGEVWRALDEVLGREVAVKVLRREYADDPTFLARFHAEAKHAANLSHPGVAAVYDFGDGTGDETTSPYLVMELVAGEPLSNLVAREGALPPDRVMDIVGQAALALQAAHDAGVIHRDVKPGNILVTPDGQVKITDFGIARAANSVPLTQTGAIMGTAHYISPEQASGSAVSPASDLYSLGIVAFECLTGSRPFAGDTPISVALAHVRDEPPALPDTVPGPVRDLVMRLLAKDPAQRPPSAGQLGQEALALAPAVAGTGPLADPAAPVDATQVLPAGVTGAHAPEAAGAYAPTVAAPAATGAHRDSDTDPGFQLPAPAGVPAWVPWAVLAVGAFILVLLIGRALAGDSAPEPKASDAAAETTAAATVEVVAEDYLGRPVEEARAELTDLGLVVDVAWSPGEGEVGTVKGLAPTGTLTEGSPVTLEAVAPDHEKSDEDEDDEKGPGKGKGRGKGRDD